MVTQFRQLDKDGSTGQLWQGLVNDHPEVLKEIGFADHIDVEVSQLGNQQESQFKTVVLTVEKWADLAIGIWENGNYLALPQVPQHVSVFPKGAATILDLPGDQWKELLDELAKSDDGKTAPKKELLRRFGYIPSASEGSGILQDDLRTTIKSVSQQLSSAIGDLSSRLRKLVHANDDKPRENPPMSAAGESEVTSKFTVRYLFRDEHGKPRFGSRP